MRSFVWLLLLVAVWSTACLGDDFRGFAWGTPKGKILEELGEPLGEDLEMAAVIYDDVVAGVEMAVHFRFEEDRLKAGAYYSKSVFSGVDAAMAEFLRFEEILAQKYKSRAEISELWFDRRFQDDEQGRQLGLMAGDLILVSSRELKRTEVRHQLAGAGEPGFGYEHRIFYRARVDVTPQEVSKEDLEKL